MEAKRVLQVLSSTQRSGGVEAMVMNLYRHIDREKLQFDFISHKQGPPDYDEEIAALGGRIFTLPLLTQSGLPRFLRSVEAIARENGPYIALHSHTDYQAGFAAWAAKRCGIPNRLCHAHLDRSGDGRLATRGKILTGRVLSGLFATRLLACGTGAARSLYGARALKTGRVQILKNGIDLSLYTRPQEPSRARLLSDLRLAPGCRLIVQIGRMEQVKNHRFTLEIIARCKVMGLPWVFLFAGGGTLEAALYAEHQKLGLEDRLRFLGVRSDVPALLAAADLLLLPSHAEGLPVVLVEAQAAGLACVVSDCVSKEADLGLGLLARAAPDGPEAWLAAMERQLCIPRPAPQTREAHLRAHGYDIRETALSYLALATEQAELPAHKASRVPEQQIK